MTARHGVLLVCAGLAITVSLAEAAIAQYEENLEIAVLATFAEIHPDRGAAETALSVPGGSPMAPGSGGLRIAHHHHAFPNLLEFGVAYHSVEEQTIATAEAAVGSFFGERELVPQPFVQGIIGILHTSIGEDQTELYIGAQGGFRYFLKPTLAARVQIGYRDMMGDKLQFSVFEFAIGIGVLI